MIELTWLQLAHPHFQEAVNAIWDCPNLDGKTSYGAHRLKKKIDSVEKDVVELRKSLMQKWAKKDESGNLVKDANNWITFEKPEDQAAFETELTAEFSAKKISMEVSKLDFQKLTNIRGLTPRHWEFLVPITENLPEEPTEAKPA